MSTVTTSAAPLRQALLAGLALFWLQPSSAVADELAPGYQWLDLGQGVYVVTRSDPFAGPVDGNSTVIVNDRDVVVVDSHIDPAVARAVIARIRKLTDKPVSYLINSHWHDDHTNGNQAYRDAFPDLEIVAHPATLETLREKWPPMLEDRRANYSRVADRDLYALADGMEASDRERAIGLRIYAGYRDALLPELAALKEVYPSLVTENLVLERGDRTIQIRSYGLANTEGDLVVWLEEEGILITGDVVVHPVPYAFDSPMRDWLETLRELETLPVKTLVPGHGRPLQGTVYLDRLIVLFEETLRLVAAAKAEGATLEQALDAITLERFASEFVGDDPVALYSWESYFRRPGVESAWLASQ